MHVLITLIEYNAVNYVSYSVVNPGIDHHYTEC